ncbi:ADP-ribosylglycohydrolase family protein [Myroides pelagicus]|uniref:ADP-ribosylglycohydrolase family protein n=1 Tax=Myroides pelagicus TaxID=270914 RepID=A0A7K1GPP3_9FLAO|nr:ADP-ribosylglycohydrolase family protein [Myroides pelagicus]MTH30882.1 hypothetical protein [Myroides pelagicus]
MSNLAQDILFGVAVADALGVPVEFKYPDKIDLVSVESNYSDHPNRLTSFGSWHKPVGTFSDDSSLTFCTAEYLANKESNLDDLMERFNDWMKQGYWTADGDTFDIGRTTLFAIENYAYGSDWKSCGMRNERDNGNGSLMRIAPLVFPLLYDNTITDKYTYISDFSSLTHGHKIAVDACYIYLCFAEYLILTKDADKAYQQLKQTLKQTYNSDPYFCRIFSDDFTQLDPSLFNNRGFVVGSLEIALHTLLRTSDYKQAILEVIALGKDTDTNAAITGALAGVLYGYNSIPSHWLAPLKAKQAIMALANNLAQAYPQVN